MPFNPCVRIPSWESRPKESFDLGLEDIGDRDLRQTSGNGDPKMTTGKPELLSARGRL